MSKKPGRPPVIARLDEIAQMLRELLARVDRLEKSQQPPQQPKDEYQPRIDRWGN